uniref:Late embryogenesis abundant protein ECP63-like domain-containing protein n=1 Tax=Aegilops tauschii subsp. strangulata TaxID=200361 RepID=A0A453I754_AEGTS
DYTVEKATEAKDTTMQKAQQTKDAAAEKARQAKDVTQQKAGVYTDATKGTAQEARDRTMATTQTHDADGGQQGTGLFGALGNMTGAIKEKLTVGSGTQQHDAGWHGLRLGDEDERAVKERAAEKAASVYFEEKDRLAKERA